VLTWDDFLAYCQLSEDEVDVVADYQRVPKIVAAQMAYYMLREPAGQKVFRAILIDDIESARKRGDRDSLARYEAVLERFDAAHGRAGSPGA
jgi:hypothetical protein